MSVCLWFCLPKRKVGKCKRCTIGCCWRSSPSRPWLQKAAQPECVPEQRSSAEGGCSELPRDWRCRGKTGLEVSGEFPFRGWDAAQCQHLHPSTCRSGCPGAIR